MTAEHLSATSGSSFCVPAHCCGHAPQVDAASATPDAPGWGKYLFAILTGLATVFAGFLFAFGAGEKSEGLIKLAVVVALVAFTIWMASVAWGSTPAGRRRHTLYFVLTGLSACAPVLATAAFVFIATDYHPTAAVFAGTVGGASLVMVAFYTALLQSDVEGWRKDALAFSLAIVTIAGAALAAWGTTL